VLISNEAFGKGSLGVDVDEFVSRCIGFMRQGEPSVVEEVDEGSPLEWHVLGKCAAFPSNRRPAVPSFLLGPLSVEKRVRKTVRTARKQKDPVTAVERPETLRAEDLERNEGTNLVNLCQSIRKRLDTILVEGGRAVEEFGNRPDIADFDDEEVKAVFEKNNLSLNHEVSLFQFAINPHSFGQSVENLFYISFLVRDGLVQISYDDDKLPTIRKFGSDCNSHADRQGPSGEPRRRRTARGARGTRRLCRSTTARGGSS
jgi:hypothetical protein